MTTAHTSTPPGDAARDGPQTRTYTVLYAQDVPHYGSVDIEAIGDDAAIAAARSADVDDITLDPDWNYPVSRRIVHIEDPDGNIVATDVPLDDFHLGNGGDEARRMCKAGADLVQALREIAAIPLWGEPIPPGPLRDEYAETGQYDVAENSFEPSGDTECDHLREAVETARRALILLHGTAP